MVQPLAFSIKEDPRVSAWANLIRESSKWAAAIREAAANGDRSAIDFLSDRNDDDLTDLAPDWMFQNSNEALVRRETVEALQRFSEARVIVAADRDKLVKLSEFLELPGSPDMHLRNLERMAKCNGFPVPVLKSPRRYRLSELWARFG